MSIRSISASAALRLLLFLMLGLIMTSAGCRGNIGPSFSGERAYSDLKRQTDFGPRVPNTAAHRACGDFLIGELKKSTALVEEQPFAVKIGGKTLALRNIIARFNPGASKKVLLLAHWDSRPTADQEMDPARRNLPIAGANDGASGVAVLLELARLFKARAPGVGVTILLVDGEDYGKTSNETMFLGSRYFVKSLKGEKYSAAILLDMIGDKDLQIYREVNSEDNAKALNDRIWKAAADLGHRVQFPDAEKYTIEDDHIPLLQAGIPSVDLIDFDYAYWHTTQDTADKCSPQSLKIVGDTVAKVVYEF